MMAENEIYADWNPWHGCTKTSPGCKYCYVYRRPYQCSQARKAGIDYRIGENFIPETAVYNKAETYTEPSLFDDITTEEQDED